MLKLSWDALGILHLFLRAGWFSGYSELSCPCEAVYQRGESGIGLGAHLDAHSGVTHFKVQVSSTHGVSDNKVKSLAHRRE
jgi:hypothetical protein